MLLLLGAVACGAKVDDVDDAGGSEGDDDDDDIVQDGLYVDCSSLGSNQPTVGPGEPGPLGFPELACNPRVNDNTGSSEFTCCSTDPAAVGGGLPNYQGKNITGGATPLFSGLNNALGTWGMCVRTSDIPTGSGLNEPAVQSCPIPCNPTWSDDEIGVVCGANRVCCQAFAMQEADCIQDEEGVWRPVTGEDIGDGTDWATGAHATHQDPAGTGCQAFAGGDINSDAFADCIRQLSVADQRGYCMALAPGQVCPAQAETYVDACELLNAGG